MISSDLLDWLSAQGLTADFEQGRNLVAGGVLTPLSACVDGQPVRGLSPACGRISRSAVSHVWRRHGVRSLIRLLSNSALRPIIWHRARTVGVSAPIASIGQRNLTPSCFRSSSIVIRSTRKWLIRLRGVDFSRIRPHKRALSQKKLFFPANSSLYSLPQPAAAAEQEHRAVFDHPI